MKTFFLQMVHIYICMTPSWLILWRIIYFQGSIHCQLKRNKAKAPKCKKSQILICYWLYSADASWNADLGKSIICLHLLFFKLFHYRLVKFFTWQFWSASLEIVYTSQYWPWGCHTYICTLRSYLGKIFSSRFNRLKD